MRRFGSIDILFAAVMLCTGLTAPVLPQAQDLPDRVLAWDRSFESAAGAATGWPMDVAGASDSEVLVADARESRALLFRFDPENNAWLVDQELRLPGAPLAVAWDGLRYLVSMRGGAGLAFLEGSPLQIRNQAVPRGTVPGTVAAVPGGGFLLYDSAAGRVLRVSGEGGVGGEVPVDSYITGLAAHPAGGFYAAYPDLGMVRLHSSDGRVQQTWAPDLPGPVPAWPYDVERSPSGEVAMVDRHHGLILLLDSGGGIAGIGSRKGRENGLLLFPAGIGYLPDGRLAVADQGNGRIQLFRPQDTGGGR